MTDLVTLAEYKAYRNITTLDLDTKHNALIKYVSALAKSYCKRSFIDNYAAQNAIIEHFNAYNNTAVFINEFPINEVISVETSIDGGVTTEVLVENTDYFIDKELGKIYTGTIYPFLTRTSWSNVDHNSLIVTYTGGYATTPDDLKLAIFDLVHYYDSEAYNPNKRLQSASVDTVSFSKLGDSAFPPHIKRVLDLYRSIDV